MLGKKRIYSQHIQVNAIDQDKVEDEKPYLRVLNDDDHSIDTDTWSLSIHLNRAIHPFSTKAVSPKARQKEREH